ncbi:MAG TPA: urease accessory protein UreE [Steroidobacteraceae bacterium]|jgi:urease accessory protein|nr:urease accessory protein UreE [Steroidobacteraceae bacterium]
MIRATQVLKAGSWQAAPADRITLTYDERHRRRLRYLAAAGTEFLLDLTRTTLLRDGDGLRLEDGRIIRVTAAAEPLLEIRASDAEQLARVAWHIGNRHLPAQITTGRILIREDSVIEDMLRGLGAAVRHVEEAFTPEPGAYDGSHSLLFAPGHSAHGHSHG